MPAPTPAPSPAPESKARAAARSLRATYAGKLQIGCAVGGTLPHSLSLTEQQLVREHFSVLTPENCMKPGPIHPEPERYDFTASDALVAFAEQNAQSVVGHCLSWHQQCPAWFFEPGLTRRMALDRLQAHIHTVVGRYRGRIQGWDVVNEAIADAGDFLRETPALAAIGEDYIAKAFEFAREADPAAELYYNDYNIEQPAKRERTLRLLEQLQARGVDLSGVGIQGHWLLDQVPFDDIAVAVESYRALNLKVMITELDIDVVDRPDCGADVSVHRAYAPAEDVYEGGCPEPVLLRQAEQYARLFETLTATAGAVTRVTFWGLHDGKTWLNTWPGKRTNHPLLFDRDCRPKPALEAVLDVARRAKA
jgi:endo-1,4-beta-xylanase